MITLAMDTTESRGSVAVRHDGQTVATEAHTDGSDYSEWLLPTVERVLRVAGTDIRSLDLYGVTTGPGSFTGVRVGLTTVKAWCEVHGKPVVGVSRLAALASSVVLREGDRGLLAAFYDAQRGQVFGAVYRTDGGLLESVGDEIVIAPEGFLQLVAKEAGTGAVQWASLDPELVTGLEGWGDRAGRGDVMEKVSPQLAATVGRIAEERAKAGKFSDPLELDANYVRRSDAEIFWKGPAAHVR